MEPLYKFILDESTGKITVQEITDYEDGKWSNKDKYWRYKREGIYYYCYEKDLNRYKAGHVYSFSPSIVSAQIIIWNAITQRYDKAQSEWKRWNELLGKMNKEWMK